MQLTHGAAFIRIQNRWKDENEEQGATDLYKEVGVSPVQAVFPVNSDDLLIYLTNSNRFNRILHTTRLEVSMRTAIAVAGLIRLAMTGELLRIDLFDPEGRQRVAQATTDDKGRFYAMFNLTTKPSLEARPDRGARERPLPGVYKVQAVIINSPNAAQAESNIVYVSR